MAQERDWIMIYLQLRGFPGLAAREVNKMSNFNSKDNQKIIKRNQKDFKSIQKKPWKGWNPVLRSVARLLWRKRVNGIKKAEKGARGGMGS